MKVKKMKLYSLPAKRPGRGRNLAITLFASALLVPSPVWAQGLTAITNATVVLRAGPAANYPNVSLFERGTTVFVHGCLPEWSWCDVSYRDVRGWLAGGYLSSAYQGRDLPIPDSGARLGLPIIPFSFDDYWDRHYGNRPWFRQRGYWAHQPHHHHHHRPPEGPPLPSRPPEHPGSPPNTPAHGPHGPHGPPSGPHSQPRPNSP